MTEIKPETQVLDSFNQFTSFKSIVVIRVHKLCDELIACVGHLFSIGNLSVIGKPRFLGITAFFVDTIDALSEQHSKFKQEVEVVFICFTGDIP